MISKDIRSAKARLIVPLVAMGSSGLAVSITLGVMMRVVNAFSQVRRSLAALMNNRTIITELHSIHKRFTEYKRVRPDENLQSEPA